MSGDRRQARGSHLHYRAPGQAQAWLDGYPQFEKALFEPQPRVQEGRLLGLAGVSAMMDDSDGIALSLYDLMIVNGCGFALDSRKIPLPGRYSPRSGYELALYGGGDYELIYTIDPGDSAGGVPSTVIGTVVAEPAVTIDGRPLEKRGTSTGGNKRPSRPNAVVLKYH